MCSFVLNFKINLRENRRLLSYSWLCWLNIHISLHLYRISPLFDDLADSLALDQHFDHLFGWIDNFKSSERINASLRPFYLLLGRAAFQSFVWVVLKLEDFLGAKAYIGAHLNTSGLVLFDCCFSLHNKSRVRAPGIDILARHCFWAVIRLSFWLVDERVHIGEIRCL
jgi:hypothetical protein